jgi:hypothetical protein
MPNLESFLNKNNVEKPLLKEPALGSFSCQDKNCNEIVNEGYIDKNTNRLYWVCVQGHESSVII